MDLSGWSLTDDPGTLQKWIIPGGGGETLHLVDTVGNTLLYLDYEDDKVPGWPVLADGKGRSMVLADEESWPVADGGSAWRDSFGDPTPGDTELRSFVGDPNVDHDGDSLPALIEHAMGSSDSNPMDTGRFDVITVPTTGSNSQCTINSRHDLRAADTILVPRFSTNLVTWQTLTASSESAIADGIVIRTYLCPAGVRGFVKLEATGP